MLAAYRHQEENQHVARNQNYGHREQRLAGRALLEKCALEEEVASGVVIVESQSESVAFDYLPQLVRFTAPAFCA